MIYKYQLIILGTLDDLSNRISQLFFKTVKELELSSDSFIVITENNFIKEYKVEQPAYVIYYGDTNGNYKNIDLVIQLIQDSKMILPVFFGKDLFNIQIPPELSHQNGLLYAGSEDTKIVNLALEAFELLRSNRKVFISYKRDESTSVAIQLYETLEKNNFDVFLDTHSIKPGEDFQEELWHRMTDCDVIVLLNTPKFLTSNWCREEIAEANIKNIGIVQLIWPNHKIEEDSEICLPVQLKDTYFISRVFNDKNKSLLKDVILRKIVKRVESIRARNLASRQNSLITEFICIANKLGKSLILQPERFITEHLGENMKRIFIPTVGIPQSINCHQSDELRKEISDCDMVCVYLIYDDFRIKDKWIKHLDWLNRYLTVKTIKKQEFKKWLEQN